MSSDFKGWQRPDPRTRHHRHRHPAEVTSDRLGDHYERWHDRTDPAVQHAISVVRDWLDEIAEEKNG
jgi:hypothetical protein